LKASVILWSLLGTLAGWRLLTAWFEHCLLFRRSRTFRADPGEEGLVAEDVEFCTRDGALLHGWWFPHPEARGVLLVCHGNAGNISDRLWIPRGLADVPLHVFLFDYRGYGRSRGIPREAATADDVLAAWECARQRWDPSCEDPPVILFGRSLGGAVALQCAVRRPVRALILESTFTSVLEIARRRYPWLLPDLLCMNRYRSDLRIAAVRAPVLVAHSPEDEVVPYDMGESLFRLAPHPWKFIRLSGTHDEAGWERSPEYAAALRRLIAEVLP
jgi:pimeloyl-ACP methyl ester carboxylesterase